MLELILAAAIDVQQVCARYRTGYTLPAAAAAAAADCDSESRCDVELAEQFANGAGVERDYDVAAYFLCEAEPSIAFAEFEGMYEHLQRMRRGEETADLAFCDHVTSGYGSTYCASARWDEMMPELEARIETLGRQVQAKTAFDALRKQGEAYWRAESTRIGEQSSGGTGYSAILLGEEVDAKQRFVESLERWTEERAPAAAEAEAKRADDQLNAAYRAAQKEIDEGGEEIAEWKTYLRDAQRAWISYRDAFAAYYAERWRGAAPAAALRREIVTRLTRERTAELRNEKFAE